MMRSSCNCMQTHVRVHMNQASPTSLACTFGATDTVTETLRRCNSTWGERHHKLSSAGQLFAGVSYAVRRCNWRGPPTPYLT